MAEVVYRILKVVAGLSLITLSVLMILLLIRQKPEWNLFYISSTIIMSLLALLFVSFSLLLFKQVLAKSEVKMKGILDEQEVNKDEEIDGSTI